MAREKKQKQKSAYKYLRIEEVEELQKASTADLFKEHTKGNQNYQAARRQKKENTELKQLKDEIKKYRDENMPEEVKTLKSRIKELKDEVDEDIVEMIEDKKALEKGFNDTIKAFAERVEVILSILAKRNQ